MSYEQALAMFDSEPVKIGKEKKPLEETTRTLHLFFNTIWPEIERAERWKPQ